MRAAEGRTDGALTSFHIILRQQAEKKRLQMSVEKNQCQYPFPQLFPLLPPPTSSCPLEKFLFMRLDRINISYESSLVFL